MTVFKFSDYIIKTFSVDAVVKNKVAMFRKIK